MNSFWREVQNPPAPPPAASAPNAYQTSAPITSTQDIYTSHRVEDGCAHARPHDASAPHPSPRVDEGCAHATPSTTPSPHPPQSR